MCYSAMIHADLRDLERQFGAKLDWDSVADAFVLRDKYKMASIPSAIDTYIIQTAENSLQKRLAKMAKAHYQKEIDKFSAKKKKYEQDVLDFEAKIKKGSKAKDLPEKLEKRRASVDWLKEKLDYYHRIEEQGAPRVFPQFYTPALIDDAKGRHLKLFRYHILPRTGKELIPFKYNLFNARRDKLKQSKMWKPLFGHNHALFPFLRFYESVDDGHGGSQIIYFEPRDQDFMWSAALYEECSLKEGLLRSLAAVTDEPPPEVAAAGHDRCPVFLQEELIGEWLNPQNLSLEESFALLDGKTETYFENSLAA